MNTQHPVDIGAAAAYIAGGGLGAVFALISLFSGHPSPEAIATGASSAVIAIAGLIRILYNRTPAPGMSAVTAPSDSQPPLRVKDLSTTDAAKGSP